MTDSDPIGSSREPGETWAEQAWLKNRHRLKRCILLLAGIGGWGAYMLLQAATEGKIYAGRYGGQRWVTADQEPFAFWATVILNAGGLAMGIGLPAWIAWDLRRLAKERSTSTLDA